MPVVISSVRQRTRAFIFIAIFVDVLGYGMILPLLPFYAQQFADGAMWAGLLRALYAGLQFFTGPLLGALSDRVGRRPVLLSCLFATAGAYLLLGLATSLEWLIAAVTLDGLTGANLIIAQAYLTDRTAPKDRTRAFGLLGAAVGLGTMAGPAFGGLLSVYGLGAPAFIAAAIALGNVLFGLWALPESLPPELRARAVSGAMPPFAHLTETLRFARLRDLLLSVFALNLVFNGLQAVFPLYTQQRFGWNAFDNGLFFGFLGVCAVVVQGFVVGRLQPRLGEGRLTLLGLGLMAATVGGVALVDQAVWLYPVVAAAATGSSLALPALTSLISRSGSAGEQGRIMGGLQALQALSMIIGPALAGWAFDGLGVARLPWLGSALVVAAWALAASALRRPIPKREAA